MNLKTLCSETQNKQTIYLKLILFVENDISVDSYDSIIDLKTRARVTRIREVITFNK